ncbi:hypothetical protein BST61_g519 [Cercospora zeina]
MPPRKEPKQQVVYPSSKAKTPAFKPLRPTKIGRTSTTESESSTSKSKPTSKAGPARPPKPAPKAKQKATVLPDSEEDDGEDLDDRAKGGAAHDNDEDDDSLPTLSTTATNLNKTTAKRKASAISIDSLNDEDDSLPMVTTTPRATTSTNDDLPPAPSASDGVPSIPQPLLLRLLHSGFAHQDTKIDTQALQIVQTYLEVFVRETIARCAAEKKEAAERGEVEEGDVGWLELEDLEKVGVGMMLDF